MAGALLAPERTLLEKIAAVHDAVVRSDTTTLLKHGRHFYDMYVAKLRATHKQKRDLMKLFNERSL